MLIEDRPAYLCFSPMLPFTQVPGVPADASSQQIAITSDPQARQTLEVTFSGETPIIITQNFNYFYCELAQPLSNACGLS